MSPWLADGRWVESREEARAIMDGKSGRRYIPFYGYEPALRVSIPTPTVLPNPKSDTTIVGLSASIAKQTVVTQTKKLRVSKSCHNGHRFPAGTVVVVKGVVEVCPTCGVGLVSDAERKRWGR